MTHLRTIVRQTFIEVLDSALPVDDYIVIGTRASKRNRTNASLVQVRFTDIDVVQNSMGDDRTHVGTLMVRVYRSGKEDEIDDLLDADEVLVTNAIFNRDWSQILDDIPELKKVTFDYNDDSEDTLGAISLQFSVEYRINRLNPNLVRS